MSVLNKNIEVIKTWLQKQPVGKVLNIIQNTKTTGQKKRKKENLLKHITKGHQIKEISEKLSVAIHDLLDLPSKEDFQNISAQLESLEKKLDAELKKKPKVSTPTSRKIAAQTKPPLYS